MINETIDRLVDGISRGQIEIYNEFSLQHEVGILLRSEFPNDKVQFERNVYDLFNNDKFIKTEIDIAVFSPDRSTLRCAIELKFPRNGKHPEQMFSFCKDICFAEQLKKAGFERSYLIIFANDKLFYSGNGEGIYGYFRQSKKLYGSIRKPTGKKNEIIKLEGSYQVKWHSVSGVPKLKYTIIEASNGQQKHRPDTI
jgi:hypothetical protein